MKVNKYSRGRILIGNEVFHSWQDQITAFYGELTPGHFFSGKYTCIAFETGKEILSKYIEFGNIIATTEYLFCITEKGHIVVTGFSPAGFNQLYQDQFKGIQFRGYRPF